MDEIPGLDQIGKGILSIIGGIVFTYISAQLPLPIFVVFYGLIFYGVITLIIGIINIIKYLFFYINYKGQSKANNLKVWKQLYNCILHSMIYIADSDGIIDEDEVNTISKIFKNITKNTIKKKDIHNAKKDIHYLTRGDIISDIGIELNKELEIMIIRILFTLIYLDGKVDNEEEMRFNHLMNYFRISNTRVSEVITKIKTDN